MTTTNQNIDAEPDDELVVIKLLIEMVLEERWELTDLGRQHLQEVSAENAAVLEGLQNPDEGRAANMLANRQ